MNRIAKELAETLPQPKGPFTDAEALELLESVPPTPELVEALASAASDHVLQGEHAEALVMAERASSLDNLVVTAVELDTGRARQAMNAAIPSIGGTAHS